MIGYILGNIGDTSMGIDSGGLIAIPAFASIFFDFLVSGQGYSIKRIGYYSKNYLEPIIKRELNWPKEELLWEEFMHKKSARRKYSTYGNLGMTAMAVLASVFIYLSKYPHVTSEPLLNWHDYAIFLVLILLFFIDIAVVEKTSNNFEGNVK